MKTVYGLAFVLVLSLVNTAVANEYSYADREVRKSDSFSDRFRDAVLPGFKKFSDPYGRTYLAPQDATDDSGFGSSNSFEAAFTNGRLRHYVGNENTSFAADPTTPTGNVFDFRF
jgi:hypothetical protein